MSIKTYLDNTDEIDFFEDLSEETKEEINLMAACAVLIHEKRLQLGMNQKQFGELLGASQTMVSKWESGDYNFTVQKVGEIFTALKKVIEMENKPQEPKTKFIISAVETVTPEPKEIKILSTGTRRSSALVSAGV